MDLSIKTRNIELTPELQGHIERKLGRFDRKLENIKETRVEIAEENTRSTKERQLASVSISGPGAAFFAEERSDTILSAIDRASESISRQIERRKGKWQDRSKTGASIRVPGEVVQPLMSSRIAETYVTEVKPMSLAEAQDQMDILGHEYLMFSNTDNKKVSLLVKRLDGRFDLIVSEF